MRDGLIDYLRGCAEARDITEINIAAGEALEHAETYRWQFRIVTALSIVTAAVVLKQMCTRPV